MALDLDALSTGVLFDESVASADESPTRHDATHERGAIVGRYVLLRQLGAGGMGEVWAAWDPQLDREIALKLLRRVRSANDRQRLLREAQAMARVTHPNIVVVYDAGEDADDVFVAMELIHGQTLRAWRVAKERRWAEIVAVYVEAARGLVAAHAVGLVHRDFKPDNAMVEAESGRVRVMDFGLAAIVDQRPSITREDDRELCAASGAFSNSNKLSKLTRASALVGTPAYMSPEQLAGRNGGSASDQFSLCLALWEALFGERPYPGATIDEVERAMHEGQLRAPTNESVPERIVLALARGLAAKPEQRWPSLRELIAELEAPAREINRARLGAFSFVVGGLLAAATWYGSRAVEACVDQQPRLAGIWDVERRAELEPQLARVSPQGADTAARVQLELDAWTQRWAAVAASACKHEDGVPEALVAAQARCLERDREALALTVDLLTDPSADAELVNHAVDLVRELPAPERCADVEQLVRLDDDRHGVVDGERADLVTRELLAAEVLAHAGRWRDVVDRLTPFAQPDAQPPDAQQLGALDARVLGAIGWAQYQQGEREAAITTLEQAYEISVRSGSDALAGELAIDLMYANTRGEPRLEQARAWDLHARALLERSHAKPLVRADRLAALGFVEESAGSFDAALTHYLAAENLLVDIGADLRRARLLDDIGAVVVQLGDIEAGRALQRESLATLSELLGPQHPDVASVHYKLGSAAFTVGEHEEAAEHFAATIEIAEATLGPDAGLVLAARTGLGAVRLTKGDHAGARAVFLQVIEGSERRFGPSSLELVPPLVNTCVAELALGELEFAEQRCQRALELLEAAHGPEHPGLLAALDNLGDLRARRADPSGARALYRRSLGIGEQAYGAEHTELDYALVGIGEASLALADHDEARASFERVLVGREREGKHAGLLARAEFGLAQLAALADDHIEARERAERALADMRRAPAIEQSKLAEIEAWLAQ